MGFGVGPRAEKVLDGETCLDLWLELKSLARVQSKLTSDGIISPRSGGAITRQAISVAAWRYCCKNPDATWEKVSKYRKASGIPITREQWDMDLVKHARNVFTPIGYQKFIKRNSYENLVSKRVS